MDYVTGNNKILKDWHLSNLRYGEDDFADDGILYKGKPYSTEFGSCKDESGTEKFVVKLDVSALSQDYFVISSDKVKV